MVVISEITPHYTSGKPFFHRQLVLVDIYSVNPDFIHQFDL